MKRSHKFSVPAVVFMIVALLMPDYYASAAEKGSPAVGILAVTIGNQVWMRDNLDVTRYRNGDEIPQVQDPLLWNSLKTGAWCYYENRSENGVTYGKLYNWYAVNDPRGLAPQGWHVPTDTEWQQLVEATGGEKASGTKLKSMVLWKAPVVGADNSSGFTAIPAGYRSSNGDFHLMGTNASFWSATYNNGYAAWHRQLFNAYSAVYRVSSSKSLGLSVRCLRD